MIRQCVTVLAMQLSMPRFNQKRDYKGIANYIASYATAPFITRHTIQLTTRNDN